MKPGYPTLDAARADVPGAIRFNRETDGTWTAYEPGDTLPADPAVPYVPAEVTMRQARLALLQAGKLADVDAAINALSEPQKSAARIEWEYSGTVRRRQPLVLALAPALGLTEAQLDALFVAAEGL